MVDQARNAGRLMRLRRVRAFPRPPLGSAIVATDHASVLRAQASIARLDPTLVRAQRARDLHYFNRSYRQYRLARAAAGKPAMSYTAARSRLRREITNVAATGMATPITARIF
jgi:hypothetical protein